MFEPNKKDLEFGLEDDVPLQLGDWLGSKCLRSGIIYQRLPSKSTIFMQLNIPDSSHGFSGVHCGLIVHLLFSPPDVDS